MTIECFNVQMARLRETFGARAYPSTREELIAKALKHLDDAAITTLITGFIASAKHAPTVEDIAKGAREFNSQKHTYALGEHRPREIAKCFDCADSGFVRVKRLANHATWAKWHEGSAPCHCYRGKLAIEAAKRLRSPVDLGAQYNHLWRSSYEIMPYHSAQPPTFTPPVRDVDAVVERALGEGERGGER